MISYSHCTRLYSYTPFSTEFLLHSLVSAFGYLPTCQYITHVSL